MTGSYWFQLVISISVFALYLWVRKQFAKERHEWQYGTPVHEKPTEKLTSISTAAWLWQESGIMCTHRMLENLEKALLRVGYELTREQSADTNILSDPAQMHPHLRQHVETELLRARELFWAPEQTPEMVEDIIRLSQKSGFGQKMLEDILYDLGKRGWRLRTLKTDRELERWPAGRQFP